MAINPEIALAVRPPNVANPLEVMAHVQALRGMQLNQQRVGLENQVTQRNLDADRALAEAFRRSTSVGDDGTVHVDYDGAEKYLTDSGFGKQALQLNTDRRQNMRAAVEYQNAVLEQNAKKAARLGQLAGSWQRVNWNETDPTKLATSVVAAQSGLQRALAQGVSEGVLAPNIAQQMANSPYTPQLEAQADDFQRGAMNAEQQHRDLIEHENLLIRRMTAESEAAARGATTAKTQAEVRGMEAGGIANQDQYNALYNKMSDEDKAKFGATYSPAVIQRIQESGMTPESRARIEESKAFHAATSQYREENAATRERMVGIRERMADIAQQRADQATQRAGERGLSANQEAIERRYDQRREDSLTQEEQKLHVQRRQLGSALNMANDATLSWDPITKEKDVKMTPDRRARLQSLYEQATERVNEIRRERGLPEVVDQSTGASIGNQKSASANPFRAGTKAPPASSIPKNPYR